MREEWRAVPGFEGFYEASSLGRIRSLSRTSVVPSPRWGTMMSRRHTGRILKPKKTGKLRYFYVVLSVGGARKNRTIHTMVCEAFHGPRPAGLEAAHWDDDKANNSADNVRWASPLDNAQDKKRNGNGNAGVRHAHAMLDDEKVVQIRREYRSKGRRALAKELGVHEGTIYLVAKRKTWKHVA